MKKYILLFGFLGIIIGLQAQKPDYIYSDCGEKQNYDFEDGCIGKLLSFEKRYTASDLDYMKKYPDSIKFFYGLTGDMSEFSIFKNLQVLCLEVVKKKISSEIKNLKNLLGLILRGKFEELPPEIGELTLLRELNLNQCKLKSLPPEIGQLTNLRYLFLDDNELKTLPKEIGNMKNLRYLFINDNQLESLPEEIGQLENLEILWVESNQIKSIPKSIGNCKKLKNLYIYDNLLTDIPLEIKELKNLTDCSVGKNKISEERKKELKRLLPRLKY